MRLWMLEEYDIVIARKKKKKKSTVCGFKFEEKSILFSARTHSHSEEQSLPNPAVQIAADLVFKFHEQQSRRKQKGLSPLLNLKFGV